MRILCVIGQKMIKKYQKVVNYLKQYIHIGEIRRTVRFSHFQRDLIKQNQVNQKKIEFSWVLLFICTPPHCICPNSCVFQVGNSLYCRVA